MNVVIVDIVAVLLILGGIALVMWRPRRSGGADGGGAPDAGTYARRIAGTMIAAFGLAISVMVTAFHFASQS